MDSLRQLYVLYVNYGLMERRSKKYLTYTEFRERLSLLLTQEEERDTVHDR